MVELRFTRSGEQAAPAATQFSIRIFFSFSLSWQSKLLHHSHILVAIITLRNICIHPLAH